MFCKPGDSMQATCYKYIKKVPLFLIIVMQAIEFQEKSNLICTGIFFQRNLLKFSLFHSQYLSVGFNIYGMLAES